MRTLLLSILLLSILLSLAAVAAGDYRLSGVVTDPSNAPISEADVDVEVAGDDPVVHHAKTDTSGVFAVQDLPPGIYSVRVSKEGFEPQQQLITLSDKDAVANIVLPLEKQKYSITVESAAPCLDTASDAHPDALTLDQNAFANLPVKDGDILSALTFFVNPSGGASPTIIVDGRERTDADLAPASIQQVRINNNAYSAEFPKPGKDRIEIETRSGSDDFHGGFSVRARNSLFDTRNPLASAKLPFSREGYEVNLGGPIVRQKLSFFLDANSEQQQQSQPVLAYLPSGVLQTDTLSPVQHDRLLGRLDWQATESNRLSLKYELHIDKSQNYGTGGFALPDLATNLYHRDYRVEISDQYVLSPRTLNSFRIALGTNYQSLTSANDEPLVIVQGAFSSGGAQVSEWREEPRTDLLDTFSYSSGSSSWKIGIDAKFHPFRKYNADNFGGTYTFASLPDYEAQQPALYTITAGNPFLAFHQNDYAWFLQYERRIGAATLFAGVRHEFQSGMSRYANLAPRLAAAFAPGKDHGTVIRVGAGVFYDRRPPPILEQSQRYNGTQAQQYVLTSPAYPVLDPAGLSSLVPAATWRIDPNLVFPRIYQASATIERQLPGGFVSALDYTFQRGNHLYRTRNINAPLPDTSLRPSPDEGNVNQIESSASSRGHILNWTLHSPGNRRFQFFAQYTLSWLRDDTDGIALSPANNTFTLPPDNYDLRPEWGRADNDIRQRFGISGTVRLPWRWTVGTLTSLRSGPPFNITTGQDDNHDGVANDRPAGVTRNTGHGPGQVSVNVHLGRKFTLHHRDRKTDIDLGVDSFNVLNHTNFNNYVGVLTSPLFGHANSALDGRQMQFALQLHF